MTFASEQEIPWGEKLMAFVLAIVFAVIFFYVLYGVIRSGTRDGIIDARNAEIAAQRRDADSTNPS
ncbi:hypothetical protein SAMN04489740_2858 [Arthrobacter alpinus]|uniref:Uncharacterized protein n=1 Tax=Arthrobacter alpinus TaxID=656366 RepID=A0A0U3R4V9_9MICC|nr:hypothetical protein MB46_17880 [Arthrobacter alpinus]SEE86835.1 hypothetical protein SAMN04489740_2858 [Arthrobacter alpinus]